MSIEIQFKARYIMLRKPDNCGQSADKLRTRKNKSPKVEQPSDFIWSERRETDIKIILFYVCAGSKKNSNDNGFSKR